MVVMAKCVDKMPEKFEDAVVKTGYGRFNIFILFVGGGCLMGVIMETMGMMFVIPSAECDLDLDLTTKGLLASISFLGVVSSSHLWGFLADTRGRRFVLFVSMVFGVITSLISSIVPKAWMFILVRYFNGFFVGGSSAIIYAYVGEFHDQKHRPKVITWVSTFVALGNIALPALSWAILPMNWSYLIPGLDVNFRPWRLLVISFSLPSFIFATCLYNLPESPKYLLTQGKHSEALQILKRVYSKNTGENMDDFPVSEIIWDEGEINDKNKKNGIFQTVWVQTYPLFKSPFLTKTLMVCLLQFGTFVSYSGFFMWYPEILNRMAELPEDSSMCGAIDYYNTHQVVANSTEHSCSDTIDEVVYQSTMFICGALIIMYILIGSIVHRVGPKNLLIIIIVLTACSGITAQFVYGNATKALMGIFLVMGTCVGLINAIAVELYPTNLRGMALAISLMAGRFGAVAGSHMTGLLIFRICSFTFYVFGLSHLVLIATVLLLPTSPRTPQLIKPIT